MSSGWKQEKLAALQKQLGAKVLEKNAEKTQSIKLKKCPFCKIGDLITLIEFDSRGPPKGYEYLLKLREEKIEKSLKK